MAFVYPTIIITFVVITLNPCLCKPQIEPTILSRSEWGARPATSVTELVTPVPYVVIHHSSVPAACYTKDQCAAAMRSMQNMHQLENHWADIGYNFAVGSDGLVYEGRGWERVGAHAVPYNNKSIGIVLIGHWVSDLPPIEQLQVTKQLIAYGVRLGYIAADYALVGHRQVRETECPGDALYKEIATWRQFDEAVQYRTVA